MLKKIRKSQNAFAYTLLAPSIILLVALIGYPMIYNIMISVQKVPLNPKLESVFVGLDNFKEVLADKEFYSSVLITIAFTFVVVVLSTVLGLAMACFLNREFVGKKLQIVANLKPRKMMKKYVSQGMILSAEFDGKLRVLEAPADVPAGSLIG